MIYRSRRIAAAFAIAAGLLLGTPVFATTGFIDQPLWITPDAPKEGDKVSLSAVFRNGESSSLVGTVIFHDGDLLLGKKPIEISSGDVGMVSVSFTITAGDHVFSATMESLAKLSGNGSTTPLSVKVDPVSLQNLFVTKDASAFGANALGLKASSEAAPILDKVGQTQDAVVAKIPDSVKTPISGAAGSVDDWREGQAAVAAKAVVSASDKVAAVDKRAAEEQKKTGSVSPSTKYVDGPLAEIKLFFLKGWALLCSTALAFYLVALFLLFIILRFIYRRISKAIKLRKERRHHAKITRSSSV